MSVFARTCLIITIRYVTHVYLDYYVILDVKPTPSFCYKVSTRFVYVHCAVEHAYIQLYSLQYLPREPIVISKYFTFS